MKIINWIKRKVPLSGLSAVGGYWIGNYFKVTLIDPLRLILVAIFWGLFCSLVTFFIERNSTEEKADK